MLKIGSHVSFGNRQLLGSVLEAVSYGSNTFMFYTGAPQNTIRSAIDDSILDEAYALMKENGIDIVDVVCHAPYIVNLANNKDAEKYKFSIDFLINEVKRCASLGVKILVLHPGSAVGLDRNTAINNIIYGLNLVLESFHDTIICLETMAGKGSEIGSTLEELQIIIDGVKQKNRIGVCLDTCHLFDSGVDIGNFDDYLDLFDKKIGIDRIKVIHINDSKNKMGSKKDRHENIGFGFIGFKPLIDVIYNSRLEHVPKILETPYLGKDAEDKNRIFPPYKFEIEMIREKKFDKNLLDKIRNFYNM